VPRTYEAVYIFDSTLEDAAINDKINRFHGMLGSSETPEVLHWGRRQLAYSIGPRENGYYVVSKFTTEPTTLPEYERALKLDDGVIRRSPRKTWPRQRAVTTMTTTRINQQ
jgi:small subunit ribosomal protein S6